jgi:hypothetical protein
MPIVLVGLAAVSCLESLPPAESCEPPGKIVGGECLRCEEPLVLIGDECVVCPPEAEVPFQSCQPYVSPLPPGDGCFGDIEGALSCVTGEATPDCSCSDDQCAGARSCIEDGECPPAVLAVAPDAVCPALEEGNITWYDDIDDPSATAGRCTCRCTRCALRCDGKGYILGAYQDGAGPDGLQGLNVDLGSLALPQSGKLGFYVRARGQGTLIALLGTTPLPDVSFVSACGIPFFDDFTELLTDSVASGCQAIPGFGSSPYQWQRIEDVPAYGNFVLTSGSSDDASGGIVEIDCVVPYIIASDP